MVSTAAFSVEALKYAFSKSVAEAETETNKTLEEHGTSAEKVSMSVCLSVLS